MIKLISGVSFKADTHSIDNKTGEYKDPLMRWPLRGAAFTNEIGEALRPVIGSYATLSWIPALLYIGADIYDKYKNNENEYSPNSKRCLKQAVFQGMASIFLPLVAVKAGQNLFSQFGKLGKDKVSLNIKEQISKTAEQFVANGKMHAFTGKDKECIKEFTNIVSNNIEFYNKKNLLKKILGHTGKENNDKITNYSEKTIKDLIQLRKDLLNPSTKVKSGKCYSKYIQALKSGQTENVAVKSVLNDYQKSKMLKGNFIKTIGGFVGLGIAIKPIDYFVENILIGKYVGPGIDAIKRK